MFHLYRGERPYPCYLLYNTESDTTSFLSVTVPELIDKDGCAYGATANLLRDDTINLAHFTVIASAKNNLEFFDKYPELFL